MSGTMNFSIPGLDALVAELEKAAVEIPLLLAPAIYAAAQGIMTDSKQHYVPVDTGVLRASGYVNPPVISGESISVELGFGGAASTYALIVHERLGVHHPIGGAKFLEIPVTQALGSSSPMSGEGGGKSMIETISAVVNKRLSQMGGSH